MYVCLWDIVVHRRLVPNLHQCLAPSKSVTACMELPESDVPPLQDTSGENSSRRPALPQSACSCWMFMRHSKRWKTQYQSPTTNYSQIVNNHLWFGDVRKHFAGLLAVSKTSTELLKVGLFMDCKYQCLDVDVFEFHNKETAENSFSIHRQFCRTSHQYV
jgi:hypothetical protein